MWAALTHSGKCSAGLCTYDQHQPCEPVGRQHGYAARIEALLCGRSGDRDKSSSASNSTFGTLDADVLQEISVMKQLDHPNIVRLVEVIGEQLQIACPQRRLSRVQPHTGHPAARSACVHIWTGHAGAVTGPCCADVPANSKLMLVMEYVEGGTILFGHEVTERRPVVEPVARTYFRDVVQVPTSVCGV